MINQATRWSRDAACVRFKVDVAEGIGRGRDRTYCESDRIGRAEDSGVAACHPDRVLLNDERPCGNRCWGGLEIDRVKYVDVSISVGVNHRIGRSQG